MINKKENIIDQLQKQYAYNDELPDLFSGYQSAIKTLSEDLYSQEFHFLYEIIQNADDNSYDNENPYLLIELKEILLEGEKVIALSIINNEKGFTEEDVRAICKIGKSNKKDRYDSIGEKGIGFKSVYNITDCPYILSNNYNFKLPKNNPINKNGLGYIVPYSISISNKYFPDNTVIILPLNKDKSALEVAQRLLKLSNQTIFFLRKLKTLEIHVEIPDLRITKKILRRDSGPFRFLDISIDDKIITEKYYVVNSEVQKPTKVSHNKRQNIKTRIVSVAIPLNLSMKTGKLFSYLPVWESIGLPFLINSDFLLTSDRENLHIDYSWNKWLRNEIGSVYLKCLIGIVKNEQIDLNEKILAYNSIPIRTNKDFLKIVLTKIYKLLKEENFILDSFTNELHNVKNIRFNIASLHNIIATSKTLPSSIINGELSILSKLIENKNTLKALKNIGVKTLSLFELIKYYLSDHTWINSNDDYWLCLLYDFLYKQNFKVDQLKSIKLVPIEGKNELFSSHEINLYFKIQDGSVINKIPSSLNKHLKLSEIRYRFIDNFLNDNSKVKHKWLHDFLGVKEFNETVLANDILKILNNKSKGLSSEEILHFTETIFSLDKSVLEKNNLPLLLKNDVTYTVNKNVQEIVVPSDFDVEFGWQHIFLQNDRDHFIEISNKYSREVLESLLKGKNALKLFPSYKTYFFNYSSSLLSSNGKDFKKMLIYKSAQAHITRMWGYEVIKPLSFTSSISISTSKSIITQLEHFFKMQISLQEKKLKAGLIMKGEFQKNGRYSTVHQSDVLEYLKNSPWMYTLNQGFQIPSSVFIDKPEIKEIFGNSIPYISEIKSQEIIKLLGLKDKVSRESLLTFLIDSRKAMVDLELIIKIYLQLDQRTNGEDSLSKLELEEKLIFIPSLMNWVNHTECIWEDPIEIDENNEHLALSKIYPDKLKEFFIKKLKVSESLSIEFYTNKWKLIQESDEKVNPITLSSIYRKLKIHVIKKDDELVNDFLEHIKIYSENENYFFEVNQLYFADDKKLKKLFLDSIPLAFLPINDGYAAWVKFYRSLNVAILSEHVYTKLDESIQAKEVQINKYLTPFAIKLMAAYIKTNNPEAYAELLKNKYFENLFWTKEFESTDKIPIHYCLDAEFVTIEDNNTVFLELESRKIYYSIGVEKYEIAKELYDYLRKNIKIPSESKNIFELYLSEKNLKRKERDGLQTPTEVNDLYDTIKEQIAEKVSAEVPTDEDKTIIKKVSEDNNDTPSPVHPNPNPLETKDLNGNNNLPGRKNNLNNSNTPGSSKKSRQKEKTEEDSVPPILTTQFPYKPSSYIGPISTSRGKHKSSFEYKPNTQSELDKLKRKLEKDSKTNKENKIFLRRREFLYEQLLTFKKYSFGWLRLLTELEYLNELENSTSNYYNVNFYKIFAKKGVLYLDLPDRFISPKIEEYENIKLILYTESKTITLSIQSVSVNKYKVRAKLWKAADLDEIKINEVQKSTLKVQSADFLWKTLLDQLYNLEINDNLLIQNLIKSNKISFIFGPPGTGKTTTLVEDILIPKLKTNKSKVLVLTPTNKSADVITEKLIDYSDFGNYFRFGNTGNDIIEQNSCFIGKYLEKKGSYYTLLTTIARFPYDQIIYESGEPNLYLKEENWDTIVIDEASMVNLSQIIGLILTVPKSTEIIIAGDPFQIRPILSIPEWEGLNIYNLVQLTSFLRDTTGINNYPVQRLMTQYRSLLHIGGLYGEYCYNDLLKSYRGNLGRPNYSLIKDYPLKCLNLIKYPIKNNSTLYNSKYLNKSSYHLYLTIFVVEWLVQFVQQFSNDKKKIGIICPYRAQSDLLYKLINANEDKLNRCEVLVSTIHGFQGDECDIIVCVFNPPKSKSSNVLINDKNVINVAISRAMDHLIILVPENYEDFKELDKLVHLIRDRSHNETTAKGMELTMFESTSYIDDVTYSTAHQPINVFGLSQYKYEIRIDDEAIDVQISHIPKPI